MRHWLTSTMSPENIPSGPRCTIHPPTTVLPTLATLLYTSMARVHMQRDMAARDWRPTASGVYDGSSMYFFSFLMVASEMLSLSNSWKV